MNYIIIVMATLIVVYMAYVIVYHMGYNAGKDAILAENAIRTDKSYDEIDKFLILFIHQIRHDGDAEYSRSKMLDHREGRLDA